MRFENANLNLKQRVFVVCAVPLVLCALTKADTIYVDAAASGANDGSSWTDAFNDLQAGLDDAAGSGEPIIEIWVAAGTYSPANPAGDRTATFQLLNGVALYGGFDGTESMLDERAELFDQTVLSGDLNGDDGLDFANNDENSYHVVTGSGAGSNAILDGFMVLAGNAVGASPPIGGGMWSDGPSNPTVVNCRFVGNAAESGGGMGNWNGASPTVTKCEFIDNAVILFGGGMDNFNESNPIVTTTTFIDNSARYGGGMVVSFDSEPVLTGCSFWDNVCEERGGGAYVSSGGAPTFANCTFLNNSATAEGGDGGAMAIIDGLPYAVNCLFAGNTTGPPAPPDDGSAGGAIYVNGTSNAEFVNCTWVDNTSTDSIGGAIFVRNTAVIALANCIVWDNSPNSFWENAGESGVVQADHCLVGGGWGGTGNIDADPLFVDPDGPDDNRQTFQDNDYRLSPGSPTIDAGNNGDLFMEITTDLDGNSRFVDDPDAEDCPWAPDSCGDSPIVDMGAYERQISCPGDANGDGVVDPLDSGFILARFGCIYPDDGQNCLNADVNGDGQVDPLDVGFVLARFGACP